MPAGGLRRGIAFTDLALGVLAVLVVTCALLMPSAADTYWHLRVGGDVFRTGAVPRVESYSFTAFGQPWREHEWLWDPVSYGLYWLGGMPLLTACCAALAIAAIALVYRLMIGPAWTRLVLLMIGLLLVVPLWSVRPHLFTLLAIPLLITLLARERFWPIPLLFALWANMHGAVALGGVVLCAATATAFLRWWIRRTAHDRTDRRRALVLAVVLPLSGAASLATPQGTGIFTFLSDSMTRIRAVGINEWQRAGLDIYGVMFWTVALAFIAILVVRRRALRDSGHASSWADWVIAGGALALMPLAASAVRNVGLFALLAVPAASRLLGPDAHVRLPWRKTGTPRPDADKPMLNLALLAACALAALGFVGWSYARRASYLVWRPIDERALAALRGCDGPLYNQYDDGGYLIWFVPEKPVFVDNRQDPYSIEHMRAQLDVQWGAAPYRPLFDRWGIRCAFLPTKSKETISALDRDRWITRFRDDRFTVLEAPPRSDRP